jgi:hypothetical protein
MEPVEVLANFDLQGVVIPKRFTLKKVEYHVVSVGRRWMDEEGLHILVMVPGERVFELLFLPGSGTWFLRRWDSARPRA